MKRYTILNWQQYGKEYIFFANLTDQIVDDQKRKEWIMLEVNGKNIHALGKKETMLKFGKLLDENSIVYSIDK